MSIADNIAAHVAEIDGDPSYPPERKALWLARLADATKQKDDNMPVSTELKEYLTEHYGLPDDADDGRAKQLGRELVKSGRLTIEQYGDLCAGRAYDKALDAAAERIGSQLLSTSKGFSNMRTSVLPDSDVQPRDIFKHAGHVDVKAPSARYSTKRYIGKHSKTGEPVMRDGQPVTTPSEREHALTGVYFRHLAAKKGYDIRPLDEHERELLKELYSDGLWCGTVGDRYYTGNKLSEVYRTKGTDLISDSTSGGTNLVPFFFDTDIVTFPLLNGELFPFVDLKELNTSNTVHTASISNVTASWSATEGSGAVIPLQTTDSLVAQIAANVYDVSMAISIGRDLLNDTPIQLGETITQLMGTRLTAELDKVIGTGDGSTQPQGLSNAPGVVAVSAKNSTAGPFVVGDIEAMISSLPKQYRANQPSICWVMNDATWFRLRGIPVSGTDQRRIFGYNYEQYVLASRPVRICNDLPAADMYFLKLALYRMWRRLGLQIQMSTEGRTLMLDNELLIVARGRYAGKLLDGGGCAAMTNAALH